MPIYAFVCDSCGHEFERLQRLSDADPTQCPECHAEQVRRQLTAPSFRLAGAGWYETDFKKDGDKKRNLAGDGGDGGEGKPAATGGDAKAPAASGDAKPASSGGDSKPAPSGGDTAAAKPAPPPAAPST